MRHKLAITKIIAVILVSNLWSGPNLNAQTDIWEYLSNWYDDLEITDSQKGKKALTLKENEVLLRVPYKGHYNDFMVPDDVNSGYLAVTVRGADGGSRINTALITPFRTKGGGGAIIEGILAIGTDENEIPPGATLRFIVGKGGHQVNSVGDTGADGGAGTGLFMKKPGGSDWYVLMVAGGGGGAFSDCCTVNSEGRSANTGTSGHYGGDPSVEMNSGGADGMPGAAGSKAGGGRGLYGDRSCIQDGIPVGTTGIANGLTNKIGQFGCGGGGPAKTDGLGGGGGGGGGYSGGGGGSDYYAGGGGGSYYNSEWVMGGSINVAPRTNNPQNGFINFYFIKEGAIALAANESKCIDDYGAGTADGTNIQLYSCNGQAAQQWLIFGSGLRLAKDPGKCIDLPNSNTANGTNIQLYDCNGTDAQTWIYDVANQMIRSKINFNKCLDLVNGNTSNGTNIQLYDCVYGNNKSNQQWTVEGIPSAMPDGTNKSIHLTLAPDKCMDIAQSGTANGTNIQLYGCNGTKAQYFTFDGRAIKMQSSPEKCLDLSQSRDANGTNIQLFDCNGTNAQQWIYDGFLKSFRSAVNTGKCIDVDHSSTNNGTNIQLWDCNGTDAQRFEIY